MIHETSGQFLICSSCYLQQNIVGEANLAVTYLEVHGVCYMNLYTDMNFRKAFDSLGHALVTAFRCVWYYMLLWF